MPRIGPHSAAADDAASINAERRSEQVVSRPRVFYELRPAQPLPDLDLSISLKSRFLSQRALQFINQLILHHDTLIFSAYLISVVAYPVFLLLDLQTSRIVSIAVSLLAMPATIIAPTHLRYHVVRLLFSSTYEVWFFSIINAITCFVCGMTLNDVRCIAMFAPWLGIQINIVLDSNLRAVRRLVWSSLLAIVMLLLVIPFVAFDWVDGVHNVVLWRYNTHEISAFAVILNGITTLLAMMARNVVRNRRNLRFSKATDSQASVVSCVACRCTLRFITLEGAAVPLTPAPSATSTYEQGGTVTAHSHARRPHHMQQMRYVPTIPVIDSEETVAPFRFLVHFDRVLKTRRFMWWMARIGIVLTLAATPIDVFLNKANAAYRRDIVPWPHFLALVATSSFFVITAAHYQKVLFRSIVTSFEFTFLDAQSLVVHLAMCDFFRWNVRAVSLIALSWIWTHWILLADALTPKTRRMLGVNVHMFAHVTGFCMGMSILVLYLMIFSEYSTQLYDRVVYSKAVLTRVFEIRVSPIFYSCYATLLAWFVKFFWRVCTCSANDLILVDGAVEYDNYLRQTRFKRQSLPWFESPPSGVSANGEISTQAQT